jgi:hypothetical protein
MRESNKRRPVKGKKWPVNQRTILSEENYLLEVERRSTPHKNRRREIEGISKINTQKNRIKPRREQVAIAPDSVSAQAARPTKEKL